VLPKDVPALAGPTEEDDNQQQRREVVNGFIERFMEKGSFRITGVRHLNPGRLGRQLCDVTFESEKEAGLVRKTFVQKVKTQDNLRDGTVNLNHAPGTRIRIEILRLLAARISEDAQDGSAIVVPHLAKPIIVLHGADGRKRALSYLQAVKSYKSLLTNADVERIADKMKRLGFSGSPEHAFAIIEEADSEEEYPREEVEPKFGGMKKIWARKSTAGKRSFAEVAGASQKPAKQHKQ
jgi:hypothetical protein